MTGKTRTLSLLLLLPLGACEMQWTARPKPDPAPKPARVQIALFRTSVYAKVGKTDVFGLLRSQLSSDPAIDVVSQSRVDKAERDEKKGRYNFFKLGDAVRVYSSVHKKSISVYDGKQKKFVKLPYYAASATIKHVVAKTEKTVEVKGGLFFSDALIHKLAERVKQELVAR